MDVVSNHMIKFRKAVTLTVISLSLLLVTFKTPDRTFFFKEALLASKYGYYHGLQVATKESKAKTLNIHIVAHTHDDVGWLKTVDQYFEGKNNTIQKGCVSCILDSVVDELRKDPKKKFTYVEMAFFSMWWDKQTPETKDAVSKLVETGQLSFSNGGWCMHDEATTHFVGMIDQTTLGHDFLKREFNFVPRSTWQIDPFGHSATQASLLGSEAGFDSIYFGRIDHQDRGHRQKKKNCEGIWDSSPNLEDSEIFWGLTGSYNGNYGPPKGFCFDVLCWDEKLVGKRRRRINYRVNQFMEAVQTQQQRTRGNNVMLTMGSDFHFSKAKVNFDNLDILISTIIENKKDYLSNLFPDYDDINVFYSTPDMYTDYKYDEFKNDKDNIMNFEVKTDDFFPYSDCDDCFWAGYFTSRPALKRLERVGSSFLQITKQIQAFFTNTLTGTQSILTLEKAVGIVQHHDAITGTSKQHVADDYAKQVQAGINVAASFVGDVIENVYSDIDELGLSDVSFCQLLNESICELSQRATMTNETASFYTVLYNGIPQTRNDVITIPVSGKGPFIVEKGVRDDSAPTFTWEEVDSYVMLNGKDEVNSQSSPYSLHFDSGEIDPISMTLYKISQGPEGEFSMRKNKSRERSVIDVNYLSTNKFTVNNGKLEIEFDGGTMKRISKPADGISLEVDKTWGYYESFSRKFKFWDSHVSGAYLFRPKTPNEEIKEFELDRSQTVVRKSPILTEVHLHYKVPWLKEIIKIYNKKSFVEIEYTIGPIDISDHTGKEIVMRMNNAIKNEGVFYTDSNAREFLMRKRSQRSTWSYKEAQPIAGNYYPVNTAIFIEDDKASMTILTDRSLGGSSIKDGSIELMAHRRILEDDSRGVGEALNETCSILPYPPYGDASRRGKGIIISGTLRVQIGAGNSGAASARREMDKMFSPLHLFTAKANTLKGAKTTNPIDKTALKEPFPENLQLITFKLMTIENHITTYLVRLGHQYGRGECDEYSLPVTFDLSKLFKEVIVDITETTLTANMEKNERVKNKKQWISDDPQFEEVEGSTNETITIHPMQIKTMLIKTSQREKLIKENV